jgi:hypothetical protein
MINCLPKLIKNIQNEKLLFNVIKNIEKYNGFDWKEHLAYNKINSYASFTIYKNTMFELKLIGLDSRYFYKTHRHEWIKVLDNDIRLCKPFVQNYNNLSHHCYKMLTSNSNLYKLYPNELLIPKIDTTSSMHLIIL